MYKLLDDDTTYFFPNGKKYTGREIKSMESYSMLADTDNYGIEVQGHSLIGIANLSALKDQYRLNDDATIDDINDARNKELDNKNDNQTLKVMNASARVAQIMAMSFTDEQALEVKDIYPEYQVDHAYKQGDFFTHEGELYKVNQAHTSASQWEPGSVGTESLYTHLTLNEDGYPIWKQPTGAHDAYNTGDIVEYNGELYKSLIDGNAYSPDAYPAGWEKYTEPTE